MRCLLILFFIPGISAVYYSLRARVLCHGNPYDGSAEVTAAFLRYGLISYDTSTDYIVAGWLKPTVVVNPDSFFTGYRIEIPHKCFCTQNLVHIMEEHDVSKLRSYESEEDAKKYPSDIGVIELTRERSDLKSTDRNVLYGIRELFGC